VKHVLPVARYIERLRTDHLQALQELHERAGPAPLLRPRASAPVARVA